MVTKNVSYVHQEAAAWMEQAMSAWAIVSETGRMTYDQFWNDSNPYLKRLSGLYEGEFAIARLVDSSDLVLHAEGPGAAHDSPSLGTVNWLCVRMEKRLRTLVEAVIPLAQLAARAAARQVDLRLTGLAPGSLYLGFAIARPESPEGFEDTDEQLYTVVREAVQSLPIVPQFVTDTEVRPEIMEALPDPALRDAAIVAAHDIAPTGRKGIHTLEISAPSQARAASILGQRERVVLGTNIRSPLMGKKYKGTFIGDLRALDLDTGRASLRHVSNGINSLRCVFGGNVPLAQKMYGKTVRVSGEYETNKDGRPRLMRVMDIQEVNGELAGT